MQFLQSSTNILYHSRTLGNISRMLSPAASPSTQGESEGGRERAAPTPGRVLANESSDEEEAGPGACGPQVVAESPDQSRGGCDRYCYYLLEDVAYLICFN